MMLKITEYCSMGCTHCLNNATTNGKDITMEKLKDCLDFIRNNDLGFPQLVISGGEPTEHKEFDKVMNYILDYQKEYNITNLLTVTTNGEQIIKDYKRFNGYIEKANDCNVLLFFQVSADVRYYPRRIDVTKRVLRNPGFMVCDDCVTKLYPQGRAIENYTNIPKATCAHCFNVKIIAQQLSMKDQLTSLTGIIKLLHKADKYCKPHLSINGEIKLGESDLCPPVATIYDDMDTILKSILNHNCNKCGIKPDASGIRTI